MARQVFKSRSPIRRSVIGLARAAALVAVAAVAVVVSASIVAPTSGPLDLSPFVALPTATPAPSPGGPTSEASPTPSAGGPVIAAITGAGQALSGAAAAITAPFRPAATSTPAPATAPATTPTAAPVATQAPPATTQPTPRGAQPSTFPGHTQPPHP